MNRTAAPTTENLAAAGDIALLHNNARPKLAQRIALQLGQYIAESGLNKGDPLGSEAELTEQFGTSRWTMREVISILRREGQIEIRRGRLGGYFVAEADAVPLGGAIKTYLEFIDVSIEETIDVRRILSELVLRLAIRRVTPANSAALRSAENKEKAIFTVAGNPVAQLLIQSARRLEVVALLGSSFAEEDHARLIADRESLRAAQIEAVIADDFAEASRIETKIILCAEEMLRRSFQPDPNMSTARFLERGEHFLGKQGTMKPEMLIHQLAADIIAMGWPVGAHLGSEPELLEHYNVGRAVFREAVRPLEQTGLLVMQAGRKSGLKVGAPSLDRVIAVSLVQFERLRATREDLCEVMQAMIVGACGEAARRNAAIELPENPGPAEFFGALGDASGNRIMATIVKVMIAQFEQGAQLRAGDERAWNAAAGERAQLVEAIRAGDVALTRRAALALPIDTAPWTEKG